MTDFARVTPESETLVNPYSLLEAVNNSSDTAHVSWLIFIGIMTYFMIAVAGVTHVDLLLETPVSLPMLQVDIPLPQFFQFAPIVLVLLHLGLIAQLVLLARKTLEFDNAIRLLETTSKRTHPLRLELHNFFFVQAIAGPHRSKIMGGFLHGMSWLTLVVLPVVLILFIQLMFLPYHNVAITWTHRIALLVDIAMLIMIGVFLIRAEASFFGAFWRTLTAHPIRFTITGIVLLLVSFFSFFVATVPGERLDGYSFALFKRMDSAVAANQAGFALPFVTARSDGSLLGVFHRNLVVVDENIVADKEVTEGEPSVSLRGRDLVKARLDRSDLHQADLTAAKLDGASLVGTDLRNARIQCADFNVLASTEDRTAAKCPTAVNADFSHAKLSGARLVGIQAAGAQFKFTDLDSAELAYGDFSGASFASANLAKSDMTGSVHAEAASFLLANMQGTDITGIRGLFADFSSAKLQGAVMDYAQLYGAQLRLANLTAATLYQAKLQGADLAGAEISGADLRFASIWLTSTPKPDGSGLADFKSLIVKPLAPDDVTILQADIDQIGTKKIREQVRRGLKDVLDLKATAKWAASNDKQTWNRLSDRRFAHAVPRPVRAQPPTPGTVVAGTGAVVPSAGSAAATPSAFTLPYKQRLTDYLARIICHPRHGNGAVATGVARRAVADQFRGDILVIDDRLSTDGCPAAGNVPAATMEALSRAADIKREN